MLSNIFGILFYCTLFIYIFIKIFNSCLIKKYNYKELYKKQEEIIKQKKFSKVMKVLLIICLITILIYIPYGMTNFYFSLAFMIIDAGEKVNNSFSIMSIILYTTYFVIITYKLYIEILLTAFVRKNNK